jgi:hypothetical protein
MILRSVPRVTCPIITIPSGENCVTRSFRTDGLGGTYSTHGEIREAYKVLVQNPEGTKPLERQSVDGRQTVRFFPHFMKHHAKKMYGGSGGRGARVLNIGTGWRDNIG